jgi:hypothetical protein
VRGDVLHRRQPPNELDDLVGALDEHVGLLQQLGHRRRVALAELQAVHEVEHVIHDVVELLGEGVDVFAVERRDEGGVEALQDRARQLVAALLAGDHRLVRPLLAFEDVVHAAHAVGDVGSGEVEQFEELVIGREQTEPHETGRVLVGCPVGARRRDRSGVP